MRKSILGIPILGPSGVVHGVAGVARAITHTGAASKELVDRRTAICAACPHAKLAAGVVQSCTICGCWTWAKIRNAAEQCPDHPPRWKSSLLDPA